MGELLTYTIKQTHQREYTRRWRYSFIRDKGLGEMYDIEDLQGSYSRQNFDDYPKATRQFYIKLKYRK